MKLIVGLGNPGLRYRNTRHNIGFLVVKEISKRFHIPIKGKKFRGVLGKGPIEGEVVTLFMPRTYMNLSGEAVGEIVRKKKARLADILVIYDDMDLKFGFIRFRKKGSAGGHKGLGSVIKHLGTFEFPRLRIGIGSSRKIDNSVKFVLSAFDSGERPLLKDIIREAAECAALWIKAGPDRAMDAFNRRHSGS